MKITLALHESLELYIRRNRWSAFRLSGYVCPWRYNFFGWKSRIYVGCHSPLLGIPLSHEHLRNSICVSGGKVGKKV